MRGARDFFLRLFLIATVLGVWQGAVTYFETPAYIMPPPSSVFMALWRGLSDGVYFEHLAVTVEETLLGFALGCGLALLLGTIIALSRRVEYFLYPFIVMFQAMPKVALIPLIVVWFGLGIASKIVSAALVAFFPLMVNTIAGLRSTEEDRVNLMRSLAASRWQIFRMLQLPNAMPFLFAGVEIAMIFALIGAIVAELSNAERGLGMMMQSLSFTMDVAGQFSILLILALLGLALNGAVSAIKRRVLFWEPSQPQDSQALKRQRGEVL
jgi:NitT/TauT family transport system permease protein